MANVIKAEMHRLFTSVSTYILIGAAFLINLINTLVYGLILGNSVAMINLRAFLMGRDEANIIYDILPGVKNFMELLKMSVGANTVLILAIFIALFCLGYRRNNYMKNVLSTNSRQQFVISNLVIIAVMSFLMYVVMIVGVAACVPICFKDLPFAEEGLTWLAYLVMQFLMMLNVGLVIYAGAEVIKSTSLALVSAIVYSSGVGSILYILVDTIVNMSVTDFDAPRFAIEEFLPLGQITQLSTSSMDRYPIAILVTVLYSSLAVVVAFLATRKREY